MRTQRLFEALEPNFEAIDIIQSDFGWWGGSDHAAVAAVCLNISSVVDAYLSSHSTSLPGSCFFGFALPVAASQGHFLMTKKLVSHSLPHMDRFKIHATSCAAHACPFHLVRLLISSQYTQWSVDAVTGAAEGGQVALLTSLLKDLEKYRYTSLDIVAGIIYHSLEKGDLDVFKLALPAGRRYVVDFEHWLRENLIPTAASREHAEILRPLLASGVEVPAALIPQRLLRLRGADSIQSCRCFLMLGAGVDERWEWSLVAASGAGQAETVRFLLDRDANIKGNFGLHALTAAAKRGWVSVVEMPIDEGIAAVETEENEDLLNPMLEAISGGHDHVVQLLLRKGAKSLDY